MFGENLKVLRAMYHYTQAEVAQAIGVSRRTIQNYESGKMFPKKKDTLQALARFFNVAPSTLLGTEHGHSDTVTQVYSNNDSIRLRMLLSDMSLLFSDGNLTEEDKDLFMKALNELYWESKGMAEKTQSWTMTEFEDEFQRYKDLWDK